ncbi:sulfatase family protein [Novipirellula artificiosorum]|nr:sulfatase [Novipirellula artificiosorum]
MRNLSVFWLLLMLGCVSLDANVTEATDRPNFVIFIADDMAWDDSGAYGHPSIRTKNIDRLAEQGMRFDRAFLTCSSCSPSRSSIMTSRYPHATGAGELHLPLPATQIMMTKPLSQSGYWTAAVGKWHLGDFVTDQVDYQQASSPEKMGDAWVHALRNRPTEKPFFLWAAHLDPHRGYKPGAIDPPHSREDVVVPPFFPDTDEVRDDMALYYDEIGRFDEHIGRVLQELDAQGIADDTFVLVLSDNGRPFPHCKTRVHVPGVRTPLIVRFPGRAKAGTTCDSVVSSIDIGPTVLELAGVPVPDNFQGSSFAGLLANSTAEIRRYAFAEHNWHDYRAFERGVLGKEFCYVRNWLPNTPGTPPADAVNSPTYAAMQQLHAEGKLTESQKGCFETPRPTEFLYKIASDPNCIANLAEEPQYRSTLEAMQNALGEWQRQTEDSFPGEDQLTPDAFDRVSGKRILPGANPSLIKK